MKSKLLLLLTLLVSAFSWGQTATYTVATTNSVTVGGTIPLGSTASYSQTFGTAKQITSGNSATLTLSGYTGKNITSIVLEMRSNTSAGAGTLNVTAGSTSIASVSPTAAFNTASWYGAWSSSYVNVTKTPSAYSIGAGENVVIHIAGTTNSIYIQKYTIVYEDACTDPGLAFGTTSVIKNDTDPNFTETATSSSAGAITYSSSATGVATVNSTTGQVTIVGPGTTTITASQVANSTYCADTATYSLTVNNTSPFITPASTAITAMTTTYGTASANQCFTFTAGNLTGSLVTVTAPSGFEVATSSGGTYAASQTYTVASGSASGTVCVRLANNTAAGTHNGNITFSDNATTPTTATKAIPNSTVNPKALTVTGLTGVSRDYNGLTSATLSGTPALSGGILFSDDVTLSGTGVGTFVDKNVGVGKTVNITGFTLTGTKASNYSLTQPTTTANINAKALSISAPSIASKVYNGSAVSGTVTPGTLSGLVGTETLNITATGLYSDANVGTGKTATVTYSRADGTNGGLANNYSLAPGTGTGDITRATPTFSPLTINLSIGGTQTITSSSTEGTLSFSSDNATIASVGTSSGIVTGVAAGTTTINVSQAASTNYNAGTATVTVNVLTISYNDGDYRSINDGNWHSTTASGSTNTWQQLVSGVWTAISNSPPTNAAGLGTKKVYVRNAILLVGTNTAPNVIVENGGVLSTSTVGATFGNLLVKTGGVFNRQANGSGVSGTFEVENNATVNFYHTNTTSRTSSIWAGTEKFHENSNFVLKSADNTSNFLIIQTNNDVSEFNGSCFGNLIVDIGAGQLQLLPSGFNKVLANNLIFRSNTGNSRISDSNYSFSILNNLEIESTYTNTLSALTTAGTATINIGGNFIHNGSSIFRLANNASAVITLNIDNNLLVNSGTLDVNFTSGATSTVNLKGDLFVAGSAQLFATNGTTATLNFTGTGDGLTDVTTQTIDVANNTTSQRISFNVNSGAYAKLINQDFALGTNSTFTVKTGGTFDFGFKNFTDPNADTSLSLTRVSSQIDQKFELQDGGTLKITSPYGINIGGDYTGNAKIGSNTTNRIFSLNAIYHYIGREYNEFGFEFDQVSGVGLPGTTGNKTVIVELENNDIFFRATGIKWFNTGYGLEIRRGIVVDDNTNRFDNDGQNGTLKMTGGTYKILTSGADFSSATYTQPGLSGNYDLSTGSKIIFAHTSATTTVQGIRGTKEYPEIEVTGEDVYHSSNGNINMKANGLFTVKENAILTGTGTNAQIVSLNDINPATVTIENNGRFKTEREKGFSGAPDNINPAPSVRTGHTTGNVLVTLQPGSIVEYSRAGDQTITHTNFSATSIPYSYQNLHISGSGNKTLQHNTATRVNENLEVLAGNTATLLVETGKVITVKQAVKLPNTVGDAKLEIKNNGQLIQIDDLPLANTGTNFIMERIAKVNREDYVYWSSPSDAFATATIPSTGSRFEWNPIKLNSNGTQGNWVAPTTTMTKGKGYIAKVPNSAPLRPDPAGDLTTNFAGKPFNGTVPVDIFRGNRLVDETNVTRFDDNWNLVGNPYPSAIDALEFLQTNGGNLVDTDPPATPPTIVGAVWVWRHGQSPTNSADPFYYNFANNYYSSDYIKYNGTGSTPPGFFDGKIAAGQGFMISMKDNPGVNPNDDDEVLPTTLSGIYKPYKNTIVFTNDMRFDDSEVHYDNTQFFRTANTENNVSANDEKHRIWLDIIKTSNGQTDTALIGYVSNATMGEDNLYDTFFTPRNEVSLYSLINTKSYIIQGRSLPFDTTDLVPLGMKIISAGNHTIAIRQVDGIFEGNQNIYLEDKQLNIIHDLKQNPYHFTAPTGVNNTRFVLRYTTNALGNADFDYDNQVVVFSKNNTVTINSSIQNIDEVQVYDVLGRQLYQNTAVENQEHSFAKDIAQQTVIVKVKLQNGIWVTKKVLVK